MRMSDWSSDVCSSDLYWVLWTGGLGALGCAVAGGHPLSILGAFVASPLTPLHPALASGTVSALIEAWVRKPTHAEFMARRNDVQTMRGWWRNRVARVLLNFFLTSMGTAIGVWNGGARMLGALLGGAGMSHHRVPTSGLHGRCRVRRK